MVIAVALMLVASLLTSGILFNHRRLLVYLATAGVLAQAFWLLTTFLDRTLQFAVSDATFFQITAVMYLLAVLLLWRRWRFPYSAIQNAWLDVPIVLLLLLTMGAAALVWHVNGFDGHRWVAHGFFNGDTGTLMILTQRSLQTDGFMHENPFAGNGYLEYPTLLHAGLATLFAGFGIGTNWLYFLPALTYIQIFLTIPLFYLLLDLIVPEPPTSAEKWFGLTGRAWVHILSTLLIVYVMSVSWDNYIYPQSHFFLTGMFLLLAALLTRAFSAQAKQPGLYIVPAAAIAFVLLLANAVTGTAAVAILIVFSLLRVLDRGRFLSERAGFLVLSMLVAAAFLLFTPGEAMFGMPHFSYTAALDVLRLGLIIVMVLLASLYALSRHTFVATASTALVAMALFTFFFSTRAIIIDNASRFAYHAFLIGFPLLIEPLIGLAYLLRRHLLDTSRSVAEQIVGWAAIFLGLLLTSFPAGSSIASSHDNLMFKDLHTVEIPTREALWWVEHNTAPHSIFIASLDTPFAIPMFTGRTLLRSNYWQSPEDSVHASIQRAFAGDRSAQVEILPLADYVLLSAIERAAWEPLPDSAQKVYDNESVVIYKLD